MNDRQLAAIPEGLQRLELGMQPEAAIEVDDAVLLSRRRDRAIFSVSSSSVMTAVWNRPETIVVDTVSAPGFDRTAANTRPDTANPLEAAAGTVISASDC